MSEYQPNSHKSKAEQKNAPEERKVKKVVSGKAKTKKNEVRRLTDIFLSEDVNSVKSYIFMDVLVPAIKKAISDIIVGGSDMLLFGKSSGSSRRSGGNVSYRSYYDDRNGSSRERDRPNSRNRFEYEDIVFETRGEAEMVREQMLDIIERYGFVTVEDVYDMADLTAPYTSNKYGWTNIRNAETMRLRDGGFVLKLPKAMPID